MMMILSYRQGCPAGHMMSEVGITTLTLIINHEIHYFIRCRIYNKILQKKDLKINFEKLSDYLAKDTVRVKTIYYNALPNPNTPKGKEMYSKSQRLHNALLKLKHFEIKLGRV